MTDVKIRQKAYLMGNLLVHTYQSASWVKPKDYPHKNKASVYRAFEALLDAGMVEKDWDSSIIQYRVSDRAKRDIEREAR